MTGMPEERTLCGVGTPNYERMGAAYYLEMRKDGFGVGTACEECKQRLAPFTGKIINDLGGR